MTNISNAKLLGFCLSHAFIRIMAAITILAYSAPSMWAQSDCPKSTLKAQVCRTSKGYDFSNASIKLMYSDGKEQELKMTSNSGANGQSILSNGDVKATVTIESAENSVLQGYYVLEMPGCKPFRTPFSIYLGEKNAGGTCYSKNESKSKCGLTEGRLSNANFYRATDKAGKLIFYAEFDTDGKPIMVNDTRFGVWYYDKAKDEWHDRNQPPNTWKGTAKIGPDCSLVWESDCYRYVTKSDGSKTTTGPNGITEATGPDGKKQWFDANGKIVRAQRADGKEVVWRTDPQSGKRTPVVDEMPNYNQTFDVRGGLAGTARGAELEKLADSILKTNAKTNGDVNFAGYCGILRDIGERPDLTEREKLYVHQIALDKLFASFYEDDGNGKPLLDDNGNPIAQSEANPKVKTDYHLYPNCQNPQTGEQQNRHGETTKMVKDPDCPDCVKNEVLSTSKHPNTIRHQILQTFTQDGYHYKIAIGDRPDLDSWAKTLGVWATLGIFDMNKGYNAVHAHEYSKALGALMNDTELFPPSFYNRGATASENLLDRIRVIEYVRSAAARPKWLRTAHEQKVLDRLEAYVDRGDMTATMNQLNALQEGLFKNGMKGYATKWCENFVKPDCLKKAAEDKARRQAEDCKKAKQKQDTRVEVRIPGQ